MNKTEVFLSLNRFFNTNDIPYAVLGNTKYFPEIINSDIDIVVPQFVFIRLDEVLGNFSTQNCLLIIQKIQHESTAIFYVLSFYDDNLGRYDLIQLDVCSNYLRNARFFLNWEYLLNNRVCKTEYLFWVVNDQVGFVYYLIKKLAKRKPLTAAQFSYLKQCYLNSPSKIIQLIQKHFSSTSLEILVEVFESDSIKNFNDNRDLLRVDLFSHNPLLRFTLVANFFLKVKRFFMPTGLIIALISVEQNSYCHITSYLQNEFKSAFRDFLVYKSEFKFALNESVTLDDYIKHKNHISKALICFRFLKTFCGYVLTYCFRLYPDKVKSKLILFNVNLFFCLRQMLPGNSPKQNLLKRIIFHLIPKPDVIIVLEDNVYLKTCHKTETDPLFNPSAIENMKKLRLYLRNTINVEPANVPQFLIVSQNIQKIMAEKLAPIIKS